MKSPVSWLLMIAIFFIQCKVQQEEAHLGSLQIEVTADQEAIPSFKEGLLLMHSFEYSDAREKFVDAQQIDPDFVMAYWGEAMTHNHPIWRQQNMDKAMVALEKIAATREERLEKAQTEFEKDLLEGAEILFALGVKKEKDEAYKNHMATLNKKYPDSHEIATLYALSLLGSSHDGRDEKKYELGARIVQSVIDENPNHPGALHYLIHSYDDPDNASKALEAANSYSQVAPDAEHALHMPSHIYVALGMWDEVISSNIASYEASVNRMKNKGLDNDARGYHAFKWLMYGHLQRGEHERAWEILQDMQQYASEKSSGRARSHLISMKAAYFIETGNWDREMADINVEDDDLNIRIQAAQRLMKGMKYYHEGDKRGLEETIANMHDLTENAKQKELLTGAAMCRTSNYTRSLPSKLQIDEATVMKMELQALLANMGGDHEASQRWFERAAILEENSSFTYGPPVIVKPSSELYGEWLLDRGRVDEAKKYFADALQRAPGRLLAGQGLDKANGSDKEQMLKT